MSQSFDFDDLRLTVLNALIEKEGLKVEKDKKIIRRKHQERIPLSFSQQRIWFFQEIEPNSIVYNLPLVIRLKGRLNISMLKKAFFEIIQRHESLRTGFDAIDGNPFQYVVEIPEIEFPVVSLLDLSTEQRENSSLKWIEMEMKRPFNLKKPPLLRGRLLKIGEEEYLSIITFHHIAADGWSLGVFLRELEEFYSAFYEERPFQLPELPIQFSDFSVWEREYLTDKKLERELNYWKERLQELPSRLELLTDYPRPLLTQSNGSHYVFHLSQSLTESLRTLSRENGTTLFMTLLTAFQLLLHRYSEEDDICVGTPIANRTNVETERLIGCFVNTLVLRSRVTKELTLREMLIQVKNETLGAFDHQDIPFEYLVDAIQPKRNLSYSPLFQVMFSLQNAAKPILHFSNLSIEIVNVDNGTSKFDLTLDMQEMDDSIIGRLEYSTELFEMGTINRLAGHFQKILEEMVVNIDLPISKIKMLTDQEWNLLLEEWNNTTVDYPLDQCVHEIFQKQVGLTPNAIAAVCDVEEITYLDLNYRSNRLARILLQYGVGPDKIVAILAERSISFLVAILSVFKAGGAYLPLDPNHPTSRIAQILKESQVKVVLVGDEYTNVITEILTYDSLDRLHVLKIEEMDVIEDSDFESRSRPNDLAYVIFTSGSTGMPKGAMVEHRGMLNHIFVMIQELQISGKDIIAQTAPQGFDISVWQFLTGLCTGAHIEIIKQDIVSNPTELLRKVEQSSISILQIVPSLLQAMLVEITNSSTTFDVSSLRWLLVTGEAISPDLCRRWFELFPQIPLMNAYGPAECSDDVTLQPIYNAPDNNIINMSIGRPVSNTKIYILDKYLNPVPINVPGELYVGGIAVGRGYINRPDLTKERFLFNPFSNNSGDRIYKTGDLGRFLQDGSIEFIGRTDHQVKIRGFRIELGEIESVIRKFAGVREAVVIALEDGLGTKRLVAYLTTVEEEIDTYELRTFVKNKLPEYMIPAYFIVLDAFPLNSNGKVDRSSLPVPDTTSNISNTKYSKARNQLEQKLVGIWEDVLKIERVGINDNFFELGGDSIISIQVISKAKQSGIKLTARQIFQYQTISELSIVAELAENVSTPQGALIGYLPLTPIQKWFFEQELPEPHYYNQALMFEASRRLDPKLVQESLRYLINHHDALRLRFEETKDGWKQHYVFLEEQGVPFVQFNLASLSDKEIESALEEVSSKFQASLNLTEGPILKIVLFELGPNRPQRLLWIIHHLVVDGLSWRILIEDLQNLYIQLEQNKLVHLPEKTSSYRQWAEFLSTYATSEGLTEFEFWHEQFDNVIPFLEIDNPDGHNTEAVISQEIVELNEEETEMLLKDVPASYNTQINDVLLAALLLGLERRSLLVDLEGHGREDIHDGIDLSRTIGWFTSLFPVHLKVSNLSSIGKLLKEVKEQLRKIPNHGIGYGVLRYLNDDVGKYLREIKQKAEISFNYLGRFDQVLSKNSILKISEESPGAIHSPLGQRSHLISIDGIIINNRLRLIWTYSYELHQKQFMEEMANRYVQALRSIIDLCQSDNNEFSYSIYDFPELDVSQSDLDNFVEARKKLKK